MLHQENYHLEVVQSLVLKFHPVRSRVIFSSVLHLYKKCLQLSQNFQEERSDCELPSEKMSRLCYLKIHHLLILMMDCYFPALWLTQELFHSVQPLFGKRAQDNNWQEHYFYNQGA